MAEKTDAIEQLNQLNQEQTDLLFSLLGNDKQTAFKIKKQNAIGALTGMSTTGVASSVQSSIIKVLENIDDNSKGQIKSGRMQISEIGKMIEKLKSMEKLTDEEKQQIDDLVDLTAEGFSNMVAEQKKTMSALNPLGFLEKMSYGIAGVVGFLDSPLLMAGMAGIGKLFGMLKEKRGTKKEQSRERALGLSTTLTSDTQQTDQMDNSDDIMNAIQEMDVLQEKTPSKSAETLPLVSNGNDELDKLENEILGEDTNIDDLLSQMNESIAGINSGNADINLEDKTAHKILQNIDENIANITGVITAAPMFGEQQYDDAQKRQEGIEEALKAIKSDTDTTGKEKDAGMLGMIKNILPSLGTILTTVLAGIATGLVGAVVGAMGWQWLKGMTPENVEKTTGKKYSDTTSLERVGAGGTNMLATITNVVTAPLKKAGLIKDKKTSSKDIYKGLYDFGGDFYEYVVEPITKFNKQFEKFFYNLGGNFYEYVIKPIDDGIELTKTASKKFFDFFYNLGGNLYEKIIKPISSGFEYAQQAFTKFIDDFSNDPFGALKESFQNSWEKVTSWMDDIWKSFTDIFENMKSFLSKSFNNILDAALSALPGDGTGGLLSGDIEGAAREALGLQKGSDVVSKSDNGNMAYQEMNKNAIEENRLNVPQQEKKQNIGVNTSVTQNNSMSVQADHGTSISDWDLTKHAQLAGRF